MFRNVDQNIIFPGDIFGVYHFKTREIVGIYRGVPGGNCQVLGNWENCLKKSRISNEFLPPKLPNFEFRNYSFSIFHSSTDY